MSIHACWKETKRPTLYSFCAFNPLLVLRSHSCSCVNYCHLVMCDIGTRWRSGHCVFLLYSNVGLGHWFQYPLMVPLSISCIKQPCMFVHRHIVLFKHCAGALQTPFKILDPPHHGILGRHLGRIQDYGLGSGYVGLSNAVDASRISYVAFCLGLSSLVWPRTVCSYWGVECRQGRGGIESLPTTQQHIWEVSTLHVQARRNA